MEKSMSVIFSVVFTMLISAAYAHKMEANSNANSLLINGKPIDFEQFSISSNGLLTMVLDDSNTGKEKPIPFKIYLKRNNQIVPLGNSIAEKEFSAIEIAQIFRFAIVGDELTIEPVNKKFLKAKKVIHVKMNFLQSFVLDFLHKKEGC